MTDSQNTPDPTSPRRSNRAKRSTEKARVERPSANLTTAVSEGRLAPALIVPWSVTDLDKVWLLARELQQQDPLNKNGIKTLNALGTLARKIGRLYSEVERAHKFLTRNYYLDQQLAPKQVDELNQELASESRNPLDTDNLRKQHSTKPTTNTAAMPPKRKPDNNNGKGKPKKAGPREGMIKQMKTPEQVRRLHAEYAKDRPSNMTLEDWDVIALRIPGLDGQQVMKWFIDENRRPHATGRRGRRHPRFLDAKRQPEATSDEEQSTSGSENTEQSTFDFDDEDEEDTPIRHGPLRLSVNYGQARAAPYQTPFQTQTPPSAALRTEAATISTLPPSTRITIGRVPAEAPSDDLIPRLPALTSNTRPRIGRVRAEAPSDDLIPRVPALPNRTRSARTPTRQTYRRTPRTRQPTEEPRAAITPSSIVSGAIPNTDLLSSVGLRSNARMSDVFYEQSAGEITSAPVENRVALADGDTGLLEQLCELEAEQSQGVNMVARLRVSLQDTLANTRERDRKIEEIKKKLEKNQKRRFE